MTTELAMSLVDGCPECVRNVEPPRSAVAVDGGWRTAYLCADCGHAWTTDWAEKALVSSRNPGVTEGKIGAQSGPESAVTDRGLATVSTRPKGA